MKIDLSKISGKEKNVWVMDPTDGRLTYLGKTVDKVFSYMPEPGKDIVLIAVDVSKPYLSSELKEIPDKVLPEKKDLTE